MTAMTVPAAARELGISVSTLRRWIDHGAPVVRRGGRGRGRKMLVDPAAVQAWRRGGDSGDAVLRARIPEAAASACWEAFRLASGPHKRPAAGLLAGTWYLIVSEICGEAPDTLPEKIEQLRKIGHD